MVYTLFRTNSYHFVQSERRGAGLHPVPLFIKVSQIILQEADLPHVRVDLTIETSGSTIFRDENDIVISSNDFFNRLAANDLVKATGSEVTDTSITATEVEFELEH